MPTEALTIFIFGKLQNKTPYSAHMRCILVCKRTWALDGLTHMSKQDDSPDYEWGGDFERAYRYTTQRVKLLDILLTE